MTVALTLSSICKIMTVFISLGCDDMISHWGVIQVDVDDMKVK